MYVSVFWGIYILGFKLGLKITGMAWLCIHASVLLNKLLVIIFGDVYSVIPKRLGLSTYYLCFHLRRILDRISKLNRPCHHTREI